MFKKNKYYKLYYMIINNIDRERTLEVSEKHHIIPKSLGGSDLDSNMIYVTPKEHYVLHHLLTKFTEGLANAKMYYAFSFFVFNKYVNENKVNARIYEYIRIKVSECSSAMLEKSKKTRLQNFNGRYHNSIKFKVGPIIVFGIKFANIKELTRTYQLSYKQIRKFKRDSSEIEKFILSVKNNNDISEINNSLRLHQDNINMRERCNKNIMQIPITLFGIKFVSILNAAKIFNVNVKTFYKRKHDVKLIEEYIIKHKKEKLKEVMSNASST